VADDNAVNASLYLPFSDLASEWKTNRRDHYYECQLLGLQWRRSDHAFRLYFDVRGEADLRNPMQSSIGITVARSQGNHRALRRRLIALQHERQAIFHVRFTSGHQCVVLENL
jgi:hypothetical protein